uniref:C2 NT-type domain-containing protein n=1 Tax=Kalanchoe fedtschenkoi TaxID=63787 RepID=A0A7N0V329_KALFE
MAIKLIPKKTEHRRRRFTVRIRPVKLEGGAVSEVGDSETTVLVETRLRFRGDKASLLSPRKEVRRASSERVVGKNGGAVSWAEEDGVLEKSCSEECEVEVLFAVLRKVDRKSEKWEEMGRVEMKIGELGKRKEMKTTMSWLPIRLRSDDGALSVAALTVAVGYEEEEGGEELGGDSAEKSKGGFFKRMMHRMPSMKSRKMTMNGGDVGPIHDSSELTRSASSPSLETQSPRKRLGFWKKGVLFSGSRRKIEPVAKKMDGGDESDAERPVSSSSAEIENGAWEVKVIVSRDGEAELRSSVAFASFDQCSEKVAGGGACSVIAAVVTHWLLSNTGRMPERDELDGLMVEGAAEWNKLGESEGHLGRFKDRHFDIETVVKAGIRPLRIEQDSSLVGFFCPEKFESLRGAVCVDGIWSDIESKPGVYIVSWNDHFCVLKVEDSACYLIDSLGERLVEACNQAFILKFDNSSVMHHRAKKRDKTTEPAAEEAKDGEEEEFFKRFLAAILVKDLEVKEEARAVGASDLHRRLQIDFQYITCILK